MIYIPGQGHVLEHRHLMQQKLRRKLRWDEHVHHKDGNKLNNVLNNLEVHDGRKHLDNHSPKGERHLISPEDGRKGAATRNGSERGMMMIEGKPTTFECMKCKEFFPEEEFHKNKSKKFGIHTDCKKCRCEAKRLKTQ